jgi:hypothetical protein
MVNNIPHLTSVGGQREWICESWAALYSLCADTNVKLGDRVFFVPGGIYLVRKILSVGVIRFVPEDSEIWGSNDATSVPFGTLDAYGVWTITSGSSYSLVNADVNKKYNVLAVIWNNSSNYTISGSSLTEIPAYFNINCIYMQTASNSVTIDMTGAGFSYTKYKGSKQQPRDTHWGQMFCSAGGGGSGASSYSTGYGTTFGGINGLSSYAVTGTSVGLKYNSSGNQGNYNTGYGDNGSKGSYPQTTSSPEILEFLDLGDMLPTGGGIGQDGANCASSAGAYPASGSGGLGGNGGGCISINCAYFNLVSNLYLYSKGSNGGNAGAGSQYVYWYSSYYGASHYCSGSDTYQSNSNTCINTVSYTAPSLSHYCSGSDTYRSNSNTCLNTTSYTAPSLSHYCSGSDTYRSNSNTCLNTVSYTAPSLSHYCNGSDTYFSEGNTCHNVASYSATLQSITCPLGGELEWYGGYLYCFYYTVGYYWPTYLYSCDYGDNGGGINVSTCTHTTDYGAFVNYICNPGDSGGGGSSTCYHETSYAAYVNYICNPGDSGGGGSSTCYHSTSYGAFVSCPSGGYYIGGGTCEIDYYTYLYGSGGGGSGGGGGVVVVKYKDSLDINKISVAINGGNGGNYGSPGGLGSYLGGVGGNGGDGLYLVKRI